MLKLRQKFNSLLLFLLGIAWGSWLVTELLSCPEWWFIGEVILLIGSGICLVRYLPGLWRIMSPGILLLPVLLLPKGDLQSILMLFLFGMWYGSDDELSIQWSISRVFCSGLLIGGVLAGIFTPMPWLIPSLAILTLLITGIRAEGSFWEMVLLTAIFTCLYFPEPVKPAQELKLEPGTVISAFSLVPDDQNDPKRLPLISFVGGKGKDLHQTATELYPVSDMVFLPELPGTVPQKSDLVVVYRLPDTGDGGSASLVRTLRPGGVLMMPREYCNSLPELTWYTLPGSNERYAAASPGRDLKVDRFAMDRQLEKHFRMSPETAPSPGILSGMLIDFRSSEIKYPAKPGKEFFRHVFPAAAALLCLLLLTVAGIRKKQMENTRIVVNCAGYTLLAASTIPLIFSGLPTVACLRTLVAILAVMWFFRRPYPRDAKYTRFAGLLSLLALGLFWRGDWYLAVTALFFGGYAFAVLDEELCRKNNFAVAPLRFLGAALGIYAVYLMQKYNLPPYILPVSALLLRFWSWFRN